jgi:hypothetical protein
MNDIAEIMGAVTNCAVAGIQAGRDIGKAERDRLQSELDAAVQLLVEAGLQIEYLHEKFQATSSGTSVVSRINGFLAAREA